MEKQQATFHSSAPIQRDEVYFREKIAQISSAEDLISDRRLLRIALGAFGLDADINSGFFIRKVLEEGTLSQDSLANKLADKSYLALSKAFGFGDYTSPRTAQPDFAETILAQYRERQFEIAVGDQHESLRLVMVAKRELPEIATKAMSEDGKWFTMLGSAPLRSVIETALGLPSSFVAIDLDQQMMALREKADAVFGSPDPAVFAEPAKLDKLLKLYLLRSEAATSGGSGQSAALQILRSSGQSSGVLSILL